MKTTMKKMKKGFIVLEVIAVLAFIATASATYQNSVEIQKIQDQEKIKPYHGFEMKEVSK